MNEVSINKSINLSEHFTLGEVTKSRYTEIYNIPSHVSIENLKRVCEWLEELRFTYNTLYCLKPGEDYESSENVEPIVINSGYRSPQLNRKVGGSPTSNHLTGCAVDIRVAGIEQALRYAVILMDYADETKQDYDEILIEKNRYGAIWLHFAVRPSDNRRKTMFLIK
jgi:uncharacterized protein YcbK (DUF882 family)